MRAIALISKNSEKIVIQKEKLYARFETDEISEDEFDRAMQKIEKNKYEKREFAFRSSDIKSWSADKTKICLEFKDGSFTWVKKTPRLIDRLRTEFAL